MGEDLDFELADADGRLPGHSYITAHFALPVYEMSPRGICEDGSQLSSQLHSLQHAYQSSDSCPALPGVSHAWESNYRCARCGTHKFETPDHNAISASGGTDAAAAMPQSRADFHIGPSFVNNFRGSLDRNEHQNGHPNHINQQKDRYYRPNSYQYTENHTLSPDDDDDNDDGGDDDDFDSSGSCGTTGVNSSSGTTISLSTPKGHTHELAYRSSSSSSNNSSSNHQRNPVVRNSSNTKSRNKSRSKSKGKKKGVLRKKSSGKTKTAKRKHYPSPKKKEMLKSRKNKLVGNSVDQIDTTEIAKKNTKQAKGEIEVSSLIKPSKADQTIRRNFDSSEQTGENRFSANQERQSTFPNKKTVTGKDTQDSESGSDSSFSTSTSPTPRIEEAPEVSQAKPSTSKTEKLPVQSRKAAPKAISATTNNVHQSTPKIPSTPTKDTPRSTPRSSRSDQRDSTQPAMSAKTVGSGGKSRKQVQVASIIADTLASASSKLASAVSTPRRVNSEGNTGNSTARTNHSDCSSKLQETGSARSDNYEVLTVDTADSARKDENQHLEGQPEADISLGSNVLAHRSAVQGHSNISPENISDDAASTNHSSRSINSQQSEDFNNEGNQGGGQDDRDSTTEAVERSESVSNKANQLKDSHIEHPSGVSEINTGGSEGEISSRAHSSRGPSQPRVTSLDQSQKQHQHSRTETVRYENTQSRRMSQSSAAYSDEFDGNSDTNVDRMPVEASSGDDDAGSSTPVIQPLSGETETSQGRAQSPEQQTDQQQEHQIEHETKSAANDQPDQQIKASQHQLEEQIEQQIQQQIQQQLQQQTEQPPTDSAAEQSPQQREQQQDQETEQPPSRLSIVITAPTDERRQLSMANADNWTPEFAPEEANTEQQAVPQNQSQTEEQHDQHSAEQVEQLVEHETEQQTDRHAQQNDEQVEQVEQQVERQVGLTSAHVEHHAEHQPDEHNAEHQPDEHQSDEHHAEHQPDEQQLARQAEQQSDEQQIERQAGQQPDAQVEQQIERQIEQQTEQHAEQQPEQQTTGQNEEQADGGNGDTSEAESSSSVGSDDYLDEDSRRNSIAAAAAVATAATDADVAAAVAAAQTAVENNYDDSDDSSTSSSSSASKAQDKAGEIEAEASDSSFAEPIVQQNSNEYSKHPRETNLEPAKSASKTRSLQDSHRSQRNGSKTGSATGSTTHTSSHYEEGYDSSSSEILANSMKHDRIPQSIGPDTKDSNGRSDQQPAVTKEVSVKSGKSNSHTKPEAEYNEGHDGDFYSSRHIASRRSSKSGDITTAAEVDKLHSRRSSTKSKRAPESQTNEVYDDDYTDSNLTSRRSSQTTLLEPTTAVATTKKSAGSSIKSRSRPTTESEKSDAYDDDDYETASAKTSYRSVDRQPAQLPSPGIDKPDSRVSKDAQKSQNKSSVNYSSQYNDDYENDFGDENSRRSSLKPRHGKQEGEDDDEYEDDYTSNPQSKSSSKKVTAVNQITTSNQGYKVPGLNMASFRKGSQPPDKIESYSDASAFDDDFDDGFNHDTDFSSDEIAE